MASTLEERELELRRATQTRALTTDAEARSGFNDPRTLTNTADPNAKLALILSSGLDEGELDQLAALANLEGRAEQAPTSPALTLNDSQALEGGMPLPEKKKT